MKKVFRSVSGLMSANTAFAVTCFFIVAFAVAYTALFGPSFALALSMLGLCVTLAVIELKRSDPP